MFGLFTNFAEATESAQEAAGGISALGLNWKSFLFQLITFVIVLLILRKFVFGKLIAVLDARQKAVDDSLAGAAKIEKELKSTQKTVASMLAEARKEADEVLSASHKEASQIIEAAEVKASERAEHIVKEAKAQMDVELGKARDALKAETVKLVASATEKIIHEKLNPETDSKLINAALQAASQERL